MNNRPQIQRLIEENECLKAENEFLREQDAKSLDCLIDSQLKIDLLKRRIENLASTLRQIAAFGLSVQDLMHCGPDSYDDSMLARNALNYDDFLSGKGEDRDK